jgi:hypothetical protein
MTTVETKPSQPQASTYSGYYPGSWLWNSAKNYARSSYPISFLYGRVRGYVQPYISSAWNVHEICDGVFIGDIASATNRSEMKKAGITHILTAVPGMNPHFPKDFRYYNVPVMDIETENISPYLGNAIMFIEEAIASGGKVLVHCMCGVSRSATIVAAWRLSRDSDITVDQTIQLIQSKRGCIDPNPGFRAQLEEYRKLDPKWPSLLDLGDRAGLDGEPREPEKPASS